MAAYDSALIGLELRGWPPDTELIARYTHEGKLREAPFKLWGEEFGGKHPDSIATLVYVHLTDP